MRAHKGVQEGLIRTHSRVGSGARRRWGPRRLRGARIAARGRKEVAVGEGSASTPANGPTSCRGTPAGHEGRSLLRKTRHGRHGAEPAARPNSIRSGGNAGRGGGAGELTALPRPERLRRAEFLPAPQPRPALRTAARSPSAPPARMAAAPRPSADRSHRRLPPIPPRTAGPPRAAKSARSRKEAARPPRRTGAAALDPAPPRTAPPPLLRRPAGPRPPPPAAEPPPRSPRGPYRRRSAPGRSRPLSVAVPCGPGGGRRGGRPHRRRWPQAERAAPLGPPPFGQ